MTTSIDEFQGLWQLLSQQENQHDTNYLKAVALFDRQLELVTEARAHVIEYLRSHPEFERQHLEHALDEAIISQYKMNTCYARDIIYEAKCILEGKFSMQELEESLLCRSYQSGPSGSSNAHLYYESSYDRINFSVVITHPYLAEMREPPRVSGSLILEEDARKQFLSLLLNFDLLYDARIKRLKHNQFIAIIKFWS